MKQLMCYFCILLMVFSFYGCGGSDGDSTSSIHGTSTTISGVASKGLVSNGTVSVYAIVNGLKGDSLATTTTDSNGNYSVDIGDYSGPILVEITGGTYTDEATGEVVNLTIPLRAAENALGGNVSVAITPLTELAARQAEYAGFSSSAIAAANNMISQMLGDDGDIIGTMPTRYDEDSAGGEYAAILAALSQMANDTSGDIGDIIDEIADDMRDGILDETGNDLLDGLSGILGEGNVPSEISDALNDLKETGFTPTGDLAEAKTLLSELISAGDAVTSEQYNAFVSYMDNFVAESAEAHMYKAVAGLMDIYNSDAVSFIKNDLGIDFDTNFDTFDGDATLNSLLQRTALGGDVKGIFSELEGRLNTINAELALSEGVSFSISQTGLDTIGFDDIDVKIMKGLVNACKAVCIYVQAINLNVTNWNVTGGDIREIEEFSDSQLEEFQDNNPNLLTYSDTSKLTEFKATIAEIQVQLAAAVTALEALNADALKTRYDNAIGFDDNLGLYEAKAVAEEIIPSIQRAFDNSEEKVIIIDNEETDRRVVIEDDGYAYIQETNRILLIRHSPASAITISGLFSGTTTPRDILEAAQTADQADEDFELFEWDSETIYQNNVIDIDWNEPIDTYTVPQANITIDGNAADWSGVNAPEWGQLGYYSIKIARDASDNFYAYVYKSDPVTISEYYYWSFSIGAQMSDEYWTSNYVQIYLNQNEGEDPSFFVYESPYSSSYDGQTIGSDGYEVKFDNSYTNMAEEGVMNWLNGSINYSWFNDTIKLLPEVTD